MGIFLSWRYYWIKRKRIIDTIQKNNIQIWIRELLIFLSEREELRISCGEESFELIQIGCRWWLLLGSTNLLILKRYISSSCCCCWLVDIIVIIITVIVVNIRLIVLIIHWWIIWRHSTNINCSCLIIRYKLILLERILLLLFLHDE